MNRSFRLSLASAIALVALFGAVAPSAAAEKGTFSIGGNFGTGMYSNSDLNDELGSSSEEIKSGWEIGGSLRYQVSPRLGLDLEVNRMKPASSTPDPGNPDIKLSTPGMAIPLNLYYLLSENDKYAFNLFGGAGLVTGAKLHGEQEGNPTEIDYATKASFYGQAGVETQWRVAPTFALTARALGRMAKAEIDDPAITEQIDLDYSGFAFGVGARLMFGGGGQ